MSLTFDYQCVGCGKVRTNRELESFACDCGGYYQLGDKAMLETPVFDAYYDPSVETYLTSYREQEKVGKAFRSQAHQQGFTIRQDTKFHQETEYIKKHKEDFLQQQWKQAGHKYQPGSKARMNNETGELTPTRRRTYFT